MTADEWAASRTAEEWATAPDAAPSADEWAADAPSPYDDADSATWGPEIAATGMGMLTGIPGAAAGGALGSAFGPVGTFLGAAIGSGITGGLGFNVTEATLEGRDPLEDITPGGMARDAALGMVLPVAAKGIGRGVSTAFGKIAARSAASADDIATKPLGELLEPLITRAQQTKDVLGRVGDAADDVLGPESTSWWHGLAAQKPEAAAKWRVAHRALTSSPFEKAREFGNALWTKKQAEALIASWAKKQQKNITEGLNPRQLQTFERSFRPLAKGTFAGPVEPEIANAVSMYSNKMDEVFSLKQALGIVEHTDDGFVPIRKQSNFVYSTLTDDYRAKIRAANKASRGAEDIEKSFEQSLIAQGMTPDEARWLQAQRKAHGLYEHERNLNIPEHMYQQAFTPLWEGGALRDMEELSNALAFGGGAPAKLGLMEMPELAKNAVDFMIERGRPAEARLMESSLRQIYQQRLDPMQAEISTLRNFTSNALLANNYWLQLSEFWKGSAFGGGIGETVRGYRMARGKDNPLTQMMGYVTHSEVPDMMGREAMATQGKLLGVLPTPVKFAQTMDTLSRRVGSYTAYSMTDRVARVGAEYLRSGKKIPAALLKEAEEVMAMPRGTGMKALTDLAGYIKADGVLPPEVHALGAANLVSRWHYNWGPGLTPEVLQNGWGSVALQLRSYLVRAWGHWMDDVGKPMAEGVSVLRKTGDASLLKLGYMRFMRSIGHQLAPAAAAQLARKLMSGQEIGIGDVLSQVATSTFGVPGVAADAGVRAFMGDTFGALTAADVPAISVGTGAVADILSGVGGAVGVSEADPRKALRGAHTLAQGAVPHLGWLQAPRKIVVGK